MISAFVDIRLKQFYFSAWKIAEIISEVYCSSSILSNTFNVAEIIVKWFQRLK